MSTPPAHRTSLFDVDYYAPRRRQPPQNNYWASAVSSSAFRRGPNNRDTVVAVSDSCLFGFGGQTHFFAVRLMQVASVLQRMEV